MKSERIDTLQAGRAIAALAVVAHHAFLAARDFGGATIAVFDYGWAGVDFFFVLSGFIIAYSIDGKTSREYIWHRIRRVYFPYAPIGIGVALLYTFVPGISAGAHGWSWLASIVLIPYGSPALSVAWTLQHEMFFYTVFALAWYTRRMWIIGIWGVSCLLPIPFIPFQAINLEFIMGVVCFYVTRRNIGTQWLWLAAALPLGSWLLLGADRDHSVLIGLSFAFVLPPLLRMERHGLKVPRVFTFLGSASYSIYLAHGIAISIAARILPNMAFCILAGVAAGLLYYTLIEKTILRKISKNPPSMLALEWCGGQGRPSD